MPRHVRDLRLADVTDDVDSRARSNDERRDSDGSWPVEHYLVADETSSTDDGNSDLLRGSRPVREVRPPDRFGVLPWPLVSVFYLVFP